jgi:integrase
MSRRGARRRIAIGISRDGSGYAVRGQVGKVPFELRFPLDTPLATMEAARTKKIQEMTARAKAGLLPRGTFAADAAQYLRAVKALPEYEQRVRDIGLWVAIFGDRARSSIQPWEIREVRDRWLTVGPKMVMRKAPGQKGAYVAIDTPLAPNTVCLRMRALENLWTVLDGRTATNPVREVPEPADRDPEPRGLPYNIVEFILDFMPPSKTRARLRVMAYVGLAPVEIKGIDRDRDLNLREPSVWIRRRRKGRNGKMAAPVVQPLNAYGVRAFKEFVAADAYGPFSTSALWKRFKAAVRRADRAQPSLGLAALRLRPYDLRHSYGTAHFAAGRDIKATQEALRQRNAVTTSRYIAAAVAPAMREASDKLELLIRQQQRTKAGRREPSPPERNRARRLGTAAKSAGIPAKRTTF